MGIVFKVFSCPKVPCSWNWIWHMGIILYLISSKCPIVLCSWGYKIFLWDYKKEKEKVVVSN